MKEKDLKLFAGVFLALLILFFITKPRHTSVNLDEFVQSILIGITAEDVAEVEVYKETGAEEPPRLILNRIDEQWWIPTHFNAKGQKTRIEQLLKDLIEMTGKVRSEDAKHHEMYGILDEQGIHLILKDETGKPLANLILGKKGEDSGSGFIRFAGKEKVYFTDKDLLTSLNVPTNADTMTHFKDRAFVDLKAIDEKKEDLVEVAICKDRVQRHIKKMEREVEVEVNDSTTTIQKETYWVLVKGGQEIELDQKEIDKFLSDVTSIHASHVVDRMGENPLEAQLSNKPRQYGLEFRNPKTYMVFKPADGEQKNIYFGNEYEKDKGYYLYMQEDGLIYKVNKSNYDKIFKWVDDLPTKEKQEE
ncbi:DUF4340 domain-containing protein [candidate division KSB1 bacterium]|nr:DUF4340 domain-containing protein [candidate division KSB1 bacterium]